MNCMVFNGSLTVLASIFLYLFPFVASLKTLAFEIQPRKSEKRDLMNERPMETKKKKEKTYLFRFCMAQWGFFEASRFSAMKISSFFFRFPRALSLKQCTPLFPSSTEGKKNEASLLTGK